MHLTRNQKRYRGLSYLDVAAIIAVILLAIGGLLIWAVTVKKDNDRAGCIMNIRNTQVLIRSYQSVFSVHPHSTASSPGGNILIDEFLGPDKMMYPLPVCPAGGNYNLPASGGVIQAPRLGDAYLRCSLASSHDHVPMDTAGW